MGADGAAPRELLALTGDERYPSLSPDGTRLALTTRASSGDDVEIAVAPAAGGAPAVLTDNAVFDSAPSWSPDGSHIAFERGPAGDDPGNDVWVDGRRRRRPTAADDDARSRRGPGLVAGRDAHRLHESPRGHAATSGRCAPTAATRRR